MGAQLIEVSVQSSIAEVCCLDFFFPNDETAHYVPSEEGCTSSISWHSSRNMQCNSLTLLFCPNAAATGVTTISFKVSLNFLYKAISITFTLSRCSCGCEFIKQLIIIVNYCMMKLTPTGLHIHTYTDDKPALFISTALIA